MGGRPLFGLNLVGWPRETLPFDLLGSVIEGAAEVCRQAGCLVLGGHSIDDPEPKFGMVVVGEADPDRLLTLNAARPGDLLVLTKPLGTGILTTALKRGAIDAAEIDPVVEVMTTLNAGAARAALDHGVRAATDVTGFGLVGHLRNLVDASGVGARLNVARLPLLPGALELAMQGMVPGGTQRNLEAALAVWSDDVSNAEQLLCVDAQTSGGLLLAVPEERVRALLHALTEARTPAGRVIGEITDEPGVIRVVKGAGLA